MVVTLCMETIAMYGEDNCERLGQNMNYRGIQNLISTCYNGHKCDQLIIHSHIRHIEHYNELNIETNPTQKTIIIMRECLWVNVVTTLTSNVIARHTTIGWTIRLKQLARY